MSNSTERNVILESIVGSVAYGLATASSDEDRLGVYMAPITDVLGLSSASATDNSYVTHEPDVTHHEIRKFLRLALKGNPTITELLWMDDYTVLEPFGAALIRLREWVLSTKAVRSAYGGYGYQQATRLMNRAQRGSEGFGRDISVSRIPKHGRHCLRLMKQGQELLATGQLTVNVSRYRDELFAGGELAASDPTAFYELFQRELAKMDTIDSVLPDEPDRDGVNNALIRLRRLDGMRLFAVGS